MDGWSSTGKDFLSFPNFQKRPIPLRKTAGDNRKPLKGFDQGCDKLGIADGLLWCNRSIKFRNIGVRPEKKIRRLQSRTSGSLMKI